MAERIVNRELAPVAGSEALPRIQFAAGAAGTLKTFAARMFALNDTFNDQLDARAQAEGEREGALDGLDGDIAMRDYGTIRGEAYNRAALASFVTATETAMIGKVFDLERGHAGDPEGLGKALDDYRRGVSAEMRRVSPEAAGAIEQRLMLRALPAVERARDQRFAAVQDRAKASLIENEFALQRELKVVGADLFSDNPKRSALAANHISVLQGELEQLYSATDPDGKPLFDAEARAKAKLQMNGEIYGGAILSWFDRQPDKVGAYLRFQETGLQVNMQSAGLGDVGTDIREFMAGDKRATQHDGMTPSFRRRFRALMNAAPEQFRDFQIYSGHRDEGTQRRLWLAAVAKYGSEAAASKWVARPGGSQHEKGNAGDLNFGGKRLDQADPAAVAWVRENAPKFGLKFRLDNEPWHIEGDPDFADEPHSATVDVGAALSPERLKAVEDEMRARISFANQLDTRDRENATRELDAEHEANYFAATQRLLFPEPGAAAMTAGDIADMAAEGRIGGDEARQLTEALHRASAFETNPEVQKELIARLYAGENIQRAVLAARSQLKPDDMKELLNQNRIVNAGGGDDGYTNAEKAAFTRLHQALSATGLMDMGNEAKLRRFNAEREFRERVLARDADGKALEKPDDVAADLVARDASFNGVNILDRKAALQLPRFAVIDPASGAVVIAETKKALAAAFKGKKLTEAEAIRQSKLLQEWEAVMAAEAAQAAKGKVKK